MIIKAIEFPLVISPNLGCPEIVSVEEIKKGKPIPLIVATQYGEFTSPLKEMFAGMLHLQPSDEQTKEILLEVVDEPIEITDWNLLSDFPEIHATREIINSELHYNVLGKETRYWKIDVCLQNSHDILLRKPERRWVPRLFDLVLTDKSKNWQKVNNHAIQFVKNFQKKFNFIHLTDLHVAKRNDEILPEVLKVKSERARQEITASYINFNDKLRTFIRKANEMADKGQLDFVVITGDLVDFAFHGWEDESNAAENNWKTFINIVIGAGKEKGKDNPGIKVAIFTSTGNHDWRLHPYDLSFRNYREAFGLKEKELKHYEYHWFDSAKFPEDKRAKLAKEMVSKTLGYLDVKAFSRIDKLKLRITRMVCSRLSTILFPLVGAILGLFGASGLDIQQFTSVVTLIVTVAVAILFFVLKYVLKLKVRKLVDFLIDNPLHAEAKALNYYLRHINPYLDYAFQYGSHSFIVMDTGADVFTGQLLDGKQIHHIKRMSIRDNLLGGSPDSRAFDSEQNHYEWSQIVWLEKVLTTLSNPDNECEKRTFVFLHAPPINPPKSCDCVSLRESKRQEPKWIPKDQWNLTFGTINHYLSQFLHLCMGNTENELVQPDVEPSIRKVDLVFSGHAHKNIEFRIQKEWSGENNKHEIRMYSDVYSQMLNARSSEEWWEQYKPVIVQTAACGLKAESDKCPPYFRKVTIDGQGQIVDFRVHNDRGTVKFMPVKFFINKKGLTPDSA